MSAPGEHDLVLTHPRVRLHLRQSQPDGPANAPAVVLVFLHFFGGSSRTWEPVMELLGGEFPCLALDLRGFGQSSIPEAAGESSLYSLDLMAGDVAAALGHLRVGRYVLVGHSMGGKVALALATGYGCPAGLQAVALVAPSPPTPEPMPDVDRQRLLAGVDSAVAARQTLAEITAHPLPPAWTAMTVEDETRVVPAAWRAWLERGSRQDISGRLERMKVPVFLLAGEKDANITPRLLRREIAHRLPGPCAREPEIVPDAGHLLPLEAPAAVADFIRRAVVAATVG